MNTTALFVEVLVIGLQAFVWIAFLAVAVVNFSGDTSLGRLNYPKLPETLVTAALLAQAYGMGMVMDVLARMLVAVRDRRAPPEVVDGESLIAQDAEETLYMKVVATRHDVPSDILLRRSKMKILRALVVNACLTVLSVLALNELHWTSRAWVVGIGLVVMAVAYLGFFHVREFHMRGMRTFLAYLAYLDKGIVRLSGSPQGQSHASIEHTG